MGKQSAASSSTISRRISTPKKGSRLYALDALRFLAACLVVMKHWFSVGGVRVDGGDFTKPWGFAPMHGHISSVVTDVGAYGDLGVQLFFLISGFVICMSSWGRSVGQFGASRITRLFPAYWFGVLFSFAVLSLFPRQGLHYRPDLVHDVLMNLTMMQGFYGVGDFDPVYWTLGVELRFYVLFAIVVAFGVTYKRVMYFCWIWLVAAAVAQATGAQVLGAIFQPSYAVFFIAGIAFFLMWKFGPTMLLWGLIGVSFLTAQVLTRPDPAAFGILGWAYPRWPMLVFLTAFYGLMALVALHKLDWVTLKGFATVGALTYPLYLLHQQVGYTIIAYIHPHLPFWPTAATAFAIVLALCYLVQRYVERPGQRWLKAGMKSSLAALQEPEGVPRPKTSIARHRISTQLDALPTATALVAEPTPAPVEV